MSITASINRHPETESETAAPHPEEMKATLDLAIGDVLSVKAAVRLGGSGLARCRGAIPGGGHKSDERHRFVAALGEALRKISRDMSLNLSKSWRTPEERRLPGPSRNHIVHLENGKGGNCEKACSPTHRARSRGKGLRCQSLAASKSEYSCPFVSI
jgi:hypothetical protein